MVKIEFKNKVNNINPKIINLTLVKKFISFYQEMEILICYICFIQFIYFKQKSPKFR